jgi:signal peptidase II
VARGSASQGDRSKNLRFSLSSIEKYDYEKVIDRIEQRLGNVPDREKADISWGPFAGHGNTRGCRAASAGSEVVSTLSEKTTRFRWLLFLIAVAIVLADQLSKHAVEKWTAVGSSRTLVPGLLNFVHSTNPGVAFGLLADSSSPWRAPLLIVFSVSVIGLIFWLLVTRRAGGPLGQCGMTLILGGAAGNVLDRILERSVTDFIDFHLGEYHWYTFNLADSAIVIGAGLVILELLRDWRHPSREQA